MHRWFVSFSCHQYFCLPAVYLRRGDVPSWHTRKPVQSTLIGACKGSLEVRWSALIPRQGKKPEKAVDRISSTDIQKSGLHQRRAIMALFPLNKGISVATCRSDQNRIDMAIH